MQNKLYRTQFSPHCLTTNYVASPQAAIVECGTHGFCEFHEAPEKETELPEKFKLPEKEKIVETPRKERIPAPQPTLI